ncbi:MAG: cytidine deaminase [Hyphomicrobiaceae bacterium]|nr:cytidine deaminase [Hyphomicrobiaceae bacterium]
MPDAPTNADADIDAGASPLDRLFAAALAARARAYAPYSNFLVGAALLDETGAIHAGCNVENAAYPVGTCAEAGAIAALCLSGASEIREAVVLGWPRAADGTAAPLCTPCGGCRQRLREFARPDVRIHIAGATGILATFTVAELLPASFGPENL